METFLAEAGLGVPPLPGAARDRLKERGEWCFSTRALKVPPSDLPHYVRKAIAGASPDYVLIAWAEQGAGSHALHYFLVQGPLQLFLEIGGESASMDRGRAAELTNACFLLAHRLAEAIPEALRRGRIPRAGRLTVVASNLREGFWEVAAAGENADRERHPPGRKSRAVLGPQDILKEAVRWCRGEA